MQLRRSHIKFSHINNIFLSHLHGDHCFGLLGLISTFALLGRHSTLHIWGPQPLKQLYQPQIDFFCQGIEYDIVLHEIDTKSREVIYEDHSVTVETIPLKHKIRCCGFLFREKQLPRHIRRDVIDAYNIPVCYINNIKAGQDFFDRELLFLFLLVFHADSLTLWLPCYKLHTLPFRRRLSSSSPSIPQLCLPCSPNHHIFP